MKKFILTALAIIVSLFGVSFVFAQQISPNYLDLIDAATNYLMPAIDPEGNGTDRLPLGSASDPIPELNVDSLNATNLGEVDYLDIDAAGVRLDSDGDGALSLTGTGDGSDENLTINLDDTPNTAVLGSASGVTTVNFGTMNASNITTLTATNVNTSNLSATVSLVSSGDAIVTNSSPSYTAKDSNNTDSDVSSSIDTDCTDTGSGTEDCDVTFSQMFNGTLTNYSFVDSDGVWQILKNMSFITGNAYFSDNKSVNIGSGSDVGLLWGTNGAADDLLYLIVQKLTANDTNCVFVSENLAPSGMTTLNDCEVPTLVVANVNGADANDYSGVIIGEYQNTNVAASHGFNFVGFAGNADGSSDATTTELAPFFRFGSTSTTPDTANGANDVLIDQDLEVNQTFRADGTVLMTAIYKDYSGTCLAGEHFIDIGGATKEDCYCQTANTPVCDPMTAGVAD